MKVWQLGPKMINNTCGTEENGTATCIEGNPHNVIIWKPIKEKSIVCLFGSFSSCNYQMKLI